MLSLVLPRVTATLLAAVLCVFATACVGPARTESDYRADIANTARVAASAVFSAHLTAAAAAEGKVAHPYLSRRLTEDEQTLQSTITTFTSVQPPTPELDALRASVTATLEEAAAIVGDMRIAAFRADTQEVVRLAGALPPLGRRLRAQQAEEQQ